MASDPLFGPGEPLAAGSAAESSRTEQADAALPCEWESGLAVGVDLVAIRRVAALVEGYGERFTRRVFTAQELAESGGRSESLAARWAAKEATAKALGTGIGQVSWTDIEVVAATRADGASHSSFGGWGFAGKPKLRLTGRAAALATQLGLTAWDVSLAHEAGLALAFVVGLRGRRSPSPD